MTNPRHSSLVKGLYYTLAHTLGPRTEDTNVTRQKGSCPCEIHSLVGAKNINQRSPHGISPCSGYYEGKVSQGNTSQGGRGGVSGSVPEKSSGEEVVLQAEHSAVWRSLVREAGTEG